MRCVAWFKNGEIRALGAGNNGELYDIVNTGPGLDHWTMRLVGSQENYARLWTGTRQLTHKVLL